MDSVIKLNATFHIELYAENDEQVRAKLAIIQHQINQMYADVKAVELVHYRTLENERSS